MDDQTKQQNQAQNDTVQAVNGQNPQPQVPQQAISVPHKEMAPLSGMTAEIAKPTEQGPEIPPELVVVVEETPDIERPVIPQEVQQAGVTHAKEHTVHHVDPQGTVQLPQMTKEQAEVIDKSTPVSNAAKWFARFVMRQIDKIADQKLVTK